MTNDVIDPQFDWPLSMVNLELFIKEKYGSASAAQATVHHYEHILQSQSIVQADDRAFSVGVKERTIRVDKETYDALPTDSRREVDSYTFEVQQNEEKSRIKIIDEKFVTSILNSYRNAVIQLGH
jgi:SET domain-containing protein